MAQRVVVELDCDASGKHSGNIRTIKISFDGTAYEIDLCAAHVAPIDEALKLMTQNGRKASTGSRASARAARAQRQSSRADNEAARAWGRENGYKVSERGRIPQDVMTAFQQQNGAPAARFSAA